MATHPSDAYTPFVFRICILAVLLAWPSSVVVAGEPAPSKSLSRADKKLRTRINTAIRRGARWLEKQQERDGSFPYRTGGEAQALPSGGTALALLTLLHCGAKPSDSAIRRGFKYLRKTYEARKLEPNKWTSGLKVYETAVTIMALAQLGTEPSKPRAGRRPKKRELSPEDRAWLVELTTWLMGCQQPNGGFSYYPYGGPDESNSQYAMLAIREARRLGVDVPQKVFDDALAYWTSTQEKEGPRIRRHVESGGDGVFDAERTVAPEYDHARGWGYRGSKPRGSMTAAGVAIAGILRHELRTVEGRAKAAKAMRDGLAWLGEHFSVTENPGWGRFHYYYLYGLERAAVVAEVIYVGKHRWYAEGARLLVGAQERDGSWKTTERGGEGVVDPCFALLFLVRSTGRSYRIPAITPSASERSGEGAEAARSDPKPEEIHKTLAALAEAVEAAKRAEAYGDAARLRAAMTELARVRTELVALRDRTEAAGLLATLLVALEEADSWLADFAVEPEDDAGVREETPPAEAELAAPADPLVPDATPLPAPPYGEIEATRILSIWCRRAGDRYAELADPAARAALARDAAQHAGAVALPMLDRWFATEASASARLGIQDALVDIGGWRVARSMRQYARRDRERGRMDALEVIYRCLQKPDEVEPERPFVRAIREFHRLRDRPLSVGIQRRLDAMGAAGVAALGQLLYIDDFGYHALTIDMLGKKKDVRAVPPLVFKMNRFKFDYREQLPAHLALVRMGWHAVPALIERLDDRAGGTWISWTLRKITRETTGTQRRKWAEWWRKEKRKHPELDGLPEDGGSAGG